ncbi:sulfite reductase subunit alpha [Paenibacillus sanfengchensis]|uniref:sulfite reductase subunit alpha n=1 Tax=Paenibacillus sanfengchensis TaxID=3119819 RepID=UPI002FE21810
MTTKQVKSVCPYCGVGCGMVLEVSGGRVVKVSGDREHPANFGRLCTKGATSAEALAESGRMEQAYLRPSREAAPVKTGMDEAIRETARRLRGVLEKHGPDALSFYVSGQMSLEAQYLINKLAKGFIRTRHIESNSRLCMASAGSGYKLSLGADGPPGSYRDIDQAELFFVIGANMADCHPILFLRLMDRVKAGARLIVVDPRRTATADKAHLYLPVRPGTDLALLNGLLHLLVQNGRTDPEFISAHTTGFEQIPEFMDDYPPARVAEITGIPEADIRTAADWIGESREWMTCWTMGLNQSTHGTWHTNAICNLHLATGAICRPGSGPFSLTGQPNAMGGREMGYMGPGLPGQRSLLEEADRRFVEKLWQIPAGTLRTETGGGTVSMFESMKSGEIKACWIICTNPVASVPNRKTVIAGLEAAELVIAQDAFLETETNRYADILLPGALWAEGEGVMVNSERNLTLMQKAVEPPGEALPDWRIIAAVACEMGYADAFTYASSEEVYREIQQAWNPKTGYDLRGATYERLREAPVQWPSAPGEASRRSPIRYLNGRAKTASAVAPDPQQRQSPGEPRILFPTADGKAVFWARPYMPPAELPDEEYPYVLNSGRLQHQWHTLTKTGKVPKLMKLNPGPFLEIHPADAARLNIRDGDRVNIASRRGRAVLPAVVTDRVRVGTCFAPFHWNDLFGPDLAVNDLTSDAVDPLSLQPELKYCAVALEKAAEPRQAVEETPPNHQPYRKEAEPMAQQQQLQLEQLEALTHVLGLPHPLTDLTLDPHEQAYLSGFLTSLRSGDARAVPAVPVLPPTAPLPPAKRYWVDGLLAGMFSRVPLPEAEKPQFPPVTILWASQTGNAEGAALHCAQQLKKAGHSVRLASMSEYPVAELAGEHFVLFIASTFGDGDPPDNGESFFRALKSGNAPSLPELQFAVLAFGDSSFERFCGFGQDLDDRLAELGGRRLLSCMRCDTDYREQAEAWADAVVERLSDGNGALGDAESPSPRVFAAAAPAVVSPASPRLTAAAGMAAATLATAAATAVAPHPDERGAGESGRDRPVSSRLLFNRLLNRPGSEKETRHYAFDLRRTGLAYEAGDALGVWPANDPNLAERLLGALRLDPLAPVHVKDQGTLPLAEALRHHYEITRINRELLQFIQERIRAEVLGDLLQESHRDKFKAWLWGRQLVDVLEEFPVSLTPAELTGLLKPLQPRLYSIASSPKLHPEEVHITVSTVRYEHRGQVRKGVCSTFLADLAKPGMGIPVFIQQNRHFRLPDDPRAPMIMVGSGTGIAPFRGFLQERRAAGAPGRNWLIFGEQREACDFYFREELEAFRKDGYLHRLDTAFSRDQADKIYVQHRLLEQGAELWAWLQEGARFYVCGDAGRMAKEVDAALRTVIRDHGGLDEDAADAYVSDMKRNKRYAKDVY